MKAALGTLYILVFFPTVFSLKCFQCRGSSASCRMVRQKCLAYETTCISLAYQSTTPLTTDSVMKGCASTPLCNVTSAIDTGNNSFYMTSTCCETDYCNSNRFSDPPERLGTNSVGDCARYKYL